MKWESAQLRRGEDEQGTVVVEPIEGLEELRSKVSEQEWQEANPLSNSEVRRCEWLMVRALLRRELQQRGFEVPQSSIIEYSPLGAPQLIDSVERYGMKLQISISHCKGFAAVAISKSRCAIDIEMSDREVEHLAERFMTPYERALVDMCNISIISIWCAKESLYKYVEVEGASLLDDLSVNVIASGGTFSNMIMECSAISVAGEIVLYLREVDGLTIVSTI